MPARNYRKGSPVSGREGPPGAIAVRGYDKVLAEEPREKLSAALRAALSFHEPERQDEGWGVHYLCRCRDRGGARRLWPCEEARAIIAALSGEEAPS